MSNQNGIDSEARTARLHPSTPHYVPFIKERKLCNCGGYPQPISSEEMSRTKEVIKRAIKKHGDDWWNKPNDEGDTIREAVLGDIISFVKKIGYDIIVKERK